MTAAAYVGHHSFVIEQSQPVAPAAGEVQLEIAYCGICGTDLHAYHGVMDARLGARRILGHELSATVCAVGADVTGVAPGDKVTVRPLVPCGQCPACAKGHDHICHNLRFLGLDADGAFQQWWTVPAFTVHKLPDDMPLELGALVEPTAVACHDVRRAEIMPGEDVLVIGGGPIGLLVAMVARQAGGTITIAELNPDRLAFAAAQGFETLSPAEGDIAAEMLKRTDGKGADVVFEVSGSPKAAATMTDAVAARGRIVLVAIHATKPEVDLFRFFWREIDLRGARVYTAADFDEAICLLSENRIDVRPLITNIVPLTGISEAFAALDGNPKSIKTLVECESAA